MYFSFSLCFIAASTLKQINTVPYDEIIYFFTTFIATPRYLWAVVPKGNLVILAKDGKRITNLHYHHDDVIYMVPSYSKSTVVWTYGKDNSLIAWNEYPEPTLVEKPARGRKSLFSVFDNE